VIRRRPVREAGQDPVELGGACSKRSSGGPLGAAREAPECRLVVFAGTASATEGDVDTPPKSALAKDEDWAV